ncbi:hypothetical protein [Streptomyces adelaidensis]|uniref:hypothetical protein n=1 Tax=Streptomyces adelaidensis TaxID=2796465 RepID=UPI001902C6D6|nr:hypothetical protein [Streptomyces adelaidensis]
MLVAGAALGVTATATAGAGAWWRWGSPDASPNTGSAPRSGRVIVLLGSPDAPSTRPRSARRPPRRVAQPRLRRTVDLVLLRTADDHGTAAGSAEAAARPAADPDVSW